MWREYPNRVAGNPLRQSSPAILSIDETIDETIDGVAALVADWLAARCQRPPLVSRP
jgi:hypothetical protein